MILGHDISYMIVYITLLVLIIIVGINGIDYVVYKKTLVSNEIIGAITIQNNNNNNNCEAQILQFNLN